MALGEGEQRFRHQDQRRTRVLASVAAMMRGGFNGPLEYVEIQREKRNSVSAKVGPVETKQGDKYMLVHDQLRCAVDGVGAGEGLVGEGGSAMRLSMRERKPTERQMSDGRSKST